jgi:hypothetical protein
MNQAILDKIRKVEPYVPGEQPKERVIKLNTNENPYPPAPGVAKVLKEMRTVFACIRIRQQISWWKNCPGFIVSGRSRFL